MRPPQRADPDLNGTISKTPRSTRVRVKTTTTTTPAPGWRRAIPLVVVRPGPCGNDYWHCTGLEPGESLFDPRTVGDDVDYAYRHPADGAAQPGTVADLRTNYADADSDFDPGAYA